MMGQQIQLNRRNTLAAAVLLGALILIALWLPGACNASPRMEPDRTRFYVDGASGDDGNPGSEESPWRTIDMANRTLRAGDTVFIRAGTYNEVIAPKNSGKPGLQITYTSYPDEHVIVSGEPNRAELVNIARSYIVIDALDFRYGHGLVEAKLRWAWLSIAGENANYNVVRNCQFVREGDPEQLYQQDYYDRAIAISSGQYNLVENNYIRGLNIGISLNKGAKYNRIRNNHITETSQSAIVIGSGKEVVQGNLIESNTLELSAIEDGIQFHPDYDSPDTSTDVSTGGIIIRNNVIRHNAENAIDLKGAQQVVIEGNVIYGMIGSNAGRMEGGWNRRAMGAINRGADTTSKDIIVRKNVIYDNADGVHAYDGYKVYNNTILFNNRDYEGSQSNWRSNSAAHFSGVAERDYGTLRLGIKNNIVGGHQNAGEVILRVGALSDVDIDYNLYFNPNQVQNVDYSRPGVWEGLSLEQWRRLLITQRTILGSEAHSTTADDPDLSYGTGVPADNLTLAAFDPLPDSPVVDKGGPLTWAVGNGTDRKLTVKDAGYFFAGYGVVGGDWIQVGTNPLARVIAVDDETNQLTLDREITWHEDDWVTLPFAGAAPDIGAREMGEVPNGPDFSFSILLPFINTSP